MGKSMNTLERENIRKRTESGKLKDYTITRHGRRNARDSGISMWLKVNVN